MVIQIDPTTAVVVIKEGKKITEITEISGAFDGDLSFSTPHDNFILNEFSTDGRTIKDSKDPKNVIGVDRV